MRNQLSTASDLQRVHSDRNENMSSVSNDRMKTSLMALAKTVFSKVLGQKAGYWRERMISRDEVLKSCQGASPALINLLIHPLASSPKINLKCILSILSLFIYVAPDPVTWPWLRFHSWPSAFSPPFTFPRIFFSLHSPLRSDDSFSFPGIQPCSPWPHHCPRPRLLQLLAALSTTPPAPTPTCPRGGNVLPLRDHKRTIWGSGRKFASEAGEKEVRWAASEISQRRWL